jgi:hypothetical protein
MSNKLAIEILNDYPLATETVRDWFLKKMIESFEQDNAPEDFKKQMLSRGVSDITLAIMFEQSPRNFFDVLDENKIVVEILRDENINPDLFYYKINGKTTGQFFEGRVVCERAAIEKAFELLN